MTMAVGAVNPQNRRVDKQYFGDSVVATTTAEDHFSDIQEIFVFLPDAGCMLRSVNYGIMRTNPVTILVVG